MARKPEMTVMSGDENAIVGKTVNHRDTGDCRETVKLMRKELEEKCTKSSIPAHAVTVELPFPFLLLQAVIS